MVDRLHHDLEVVLNNWSQMQHIDSDSAGDAADRFEVSFYTFIETLRDWYATLESRPTTVDEAMKIPVIRAIANQLPGPLCINFETELEYIVEGKIREEDDVES